MEVLRSVDSDQLLDTLLRLKNFNVLETNQSLQQCALIQALEEKTVVVQEQARALPLSLSSSSTRFQELLDFCMLKRALRSPLPTFQRRSMSIEAGIRQKVSILSTKDIDSQSSWSGEWGLMTAMPC